jgi:hypothetical protein
VLLQVVALVDGNGDGAADSLAVLVEGANVASGLAWLDGDLLYLSHSDSGAVGILTRCAGADRFALEGRVRCAGLAWLPGGVER